MTGHGVYVFCVLWLSMTRRCVPNKGSCCHPAQACHSCCCFPAQAFAGGRALCVLCCMLHLLDTTLRQSVRAACIAELATTALPEDLARRFLSVHECKLCVPSLSRCHTVSHSITTCMRSCLAAPAADPVEREPGTVNTHTGFSGNRLVMSLVDPALNS